MDRLETFYKKLDSINHWVGMAFSWLSIPIVAIVMLDVITRRFFTLGSVTLQELEWHLYAVLFLVCMGYAYLHDAHVRVDIFRSRLPDYYKAWIELAGCLIFLLPYCVVILWLGSRFVADSYALNEISDAPGGLTHRYIIKAFLPIGFVFLFMQGIATALRQIVYLGRHHQAGGNA